MTTNVEWCPGQDPGTEMGQQIKTSENLNEVQILDNAPILTG